MLTEYSTCDDIRKFRNKVWNKFEDMRFGWLYPIINKKTLEWHRNSNAVKKGHYHSFSSKFTVDNQVMYFCIKPALEHDGTISKNLFSPSIATYVETNKGKLYYQFDRRRIDIMTTHFMKRVTERWDYKYRISVKDSKVARFHRCGETYEYRVYADYIMITKRLAHDIIYFKTFLHRDIITGRNHKELIARAEQGVDYNDIYEWK